MDEKFIGGCKENERRHSVNKPAVNLLMMRGRIICKGIRGTANIAIDSFFTPASISFKPVTESAAANPILKIKKVFGICELQMKLRCTLMIHLIPTDQHITNWSLKIKKLHLEKSLIRISEIYIHYPHKKL